MDGSIDAMLTRLVRECGSWWAAQRRVQNEHGIHLVQRASEIARRERGAEWLAVNRPLGARQRRSR